MEVYPHGELKDFYMNEQQAKTLNAPEGSTVNSVDMAWITAGELRSLGFHVPVVHDNLKITALQFRKGNCYIHVHPIDCNTTLVVSNV